MISSLLTNSEIAVDAIKIAIDDVILKEAFLVNSNFNSLSGSDIVDIEKNIIVPIEQAQLIVTTKIIQFLKEIESLQKNAEVITYLTSTMHVAISLIDSSSSNLKSSALNYINKGIDVISKNTLGLSSSLSFALIMESVSATSCAKVYYPVVLANVVNASKLLNSCAENGLKRLSHSLKHSGLLARSINVMTNDLLKNLHKCSLDICVSNVRFYNSYKYYIVYYFSACFLFQLLIATGKDISAILKNTADVTAEATNNMSVFNKYFETCVRSIIEPVRATTR